MSADREERLRAEVLEASLTLHTRGWVANHDGNVSARLGEGRLLATPTAVSKGAVRPETLIVVDGDGRVLSGTRKSFSELKFHLAIYAVRPDVEVVVHAHPPSATGLAVAGVELGEPFLAEPVVSLGRRVPLVAHALPDEDLGGFAAAFEGADAVMMANHGVFTVGPDVETALLRLELVEHLSRIFLAARQAGGPRPLPEALVQKLQARHEQLFPRARGGAGPTLGGQNPSASPAAVATSGPDPRPAADIVADALRRFR